VEEETSSSKAPADPLKSIGPLVLLGYVLTRPPVLVVFRALVWVALLFIRPAVWLVRALQRRLNVKARPGNFPREAADLL